MLKTKTKKLSNIYLLEAFWLASIIVASWALVSVRSNYTITDNGNPPVRMSSSASNAGATVIQSSKPDGKQDTNKSERSGKQVSAADLFKPKKTLLNLRGGLDKYQASFTKFGKTYPLRVYKPQALPNDTYANQWWVTPTGMESAWSVPSGDNDVTIAIIDTGFALNHQEFSSRWATNSGESGATATEAASDLNCTGRSLSLNKSCNNIDDNFDGIVDNESGTTTIENPSWLNCTAQSKALNKSCNRIDDDGNGLVDDYRGWDFSNYDQSVQAGETDPDGDGTTHGTMTAGTLAATGNNNVGIAGVNWHAKVLPIQALDDDSYGDSVTVGESVYYAVDRGADIISISLGTSADDPYLREAIMYAMENGVAVVAAAGNDGCNCMSYPANYPEVVSVGAMSPSGSRASFSSYGSNLDIIAPGQQMIAPVWTKNNQVSAYASNIAGTSFATPFIAGVLGLMREHQPNASWDEIIGTMTENADRKNLTASSPHSSTIGFGSVVASDALSRAARSFSPFTSYLFDGTILGSERIKKCDSGIIPGSFLYELNGRGQVDYTINQYEKRKKTAAGWTAKKLFGLCVGLPTDTPDFIRMLNLSEEIRNQQLKQ